MRTPLLLAALVAAGTIALWPRPAPAQQVCGEREAVVARLAEHFGEVRRDAAPASLSAFYELFASEPGGTWTLLLSDVDGVSCIVAAGRDWRPRGPGSLAERARPETAPVR